MSNVWLEKATELKSALQEQALADYLKNNSQADIARMAGEGFAAIPEREQASIITMVKVDTKDILNMTSEDAKTVLSNCKVKVQLADMSDDQRSAGQTTPISNEWFEKAAELKSAILDRALAEYLTNNIQAEIASAAGESFTAIPEREQVSIISTLAADLESKLQGQPAP
ncbi:hypothetical protein [Pseudomonas savastanoi]|uniref:hypothetical protein n=1 Tax=Pseudomonas savastanoi TaxID=29438 RepID=UPI000E327AEC|nr:hypothetical protein [Pseudomonas savastanoi]